MRLGVLFRSLIIASILFLARSVHAGPGAWTATGSLSTGLFGGQTATTLENGMVLIAGGTALNGAAPTPALYNPSTGAFTNTGHLNTGRSCHTATLLNNGMVLIAGGVNSNGTGQLLSSAELYNPATGTFTLTGSLKNFRCDASATVLKSGLVLIAGGEGGNSLLIAAAELYNPGTGTFSVGGNLNVATFQHTATLLDNGTVLIVGGRARVCGVSCSFVATTRAELFNPQTGSFTLTGSLTNARFVHTATLLNSGEVLIAGGAATTRGSTVGTSAELYNPATARFTVTGNLNHSRYDHTANLLNNGTVLLAGGIDSTVSSTNSAEIYNPGAGGFSLTGSLVHPRAGHTSTLLGNGMVLAVAGTAVTGQIGTAEVYDPTSLVPSGLLSITLSPINAALPVGDSLGFAATGSFSGGGTETLASVTWTSSNTSVATVSNDWTNQGTGLAVAAGSTTIKACTGSVCGSTALTVAAHSNLILGSQPTDTARSTFEKYGDSGNLLLTGNLNIPRADHSATLLNDGHIFVAGGTDDNTSWQIFGQNGNVLSSGLLQDGRVLAATTLLTNGNIFLAGGASSPGTWEIRSPAGALVASGNLNGSRTGGVSAATLKNGNIWISGSAVANGDACTWEIHNINGTLVGSGSLNSCFGAAQVQVLDNGNIILLGGANAPGTWEIRSPTGTFVSTGSFVNAFNNGASSVLLNNGNVFVFGSCQLSNPPEPPDTNGCGSQGSPSTWEIRDVNGSFVSTASLFNTRDGAGAAVLSNGNVFITGGSSCPACWEIRSQNGSLVSQGSLFNTRYGGHTLTHF